jgi:hypothetical protein
LGGTTALRLNHRSVHGPSVEIRQGLTTDGGFRLEVVACTHDGHRLLIDELVVPHELLVEAWERAHVRYHAQRGELEAVRAEGALVAAQWGPTPRPLFRTAAGA